MRSRDFAKHGLSRAGRSRFWAIGLLAGAFIACSSAPDAGTAVQTAGTGSVASATAGAGGNARGGAFSNEGGAHAGGGAESGGAHPSTGGAGAGGASSSFGGAVAAGGSPASVARPRSVELSARQLEAAPGERPWSVLAAQQPARTAPAISMRRPTRRALPRTVPFAHCTRATTVHCIESGERPTKRRRTFLLSRRGASSTSRPAPLPR